MAAARLIVAEAGRVTVVARPRKLSERRRWCTYEKYVSILLVRTAEMAPTICRSIRKEAGKMSRAADGVRARRRSDRQDTGKICDVS